MRDWDIVSLLRHSRHDWLNKIQLIKGNLALKHIERANEIIDELIIEARHEAKLSNLHIPKLAEFLLTFNWSEHMYRLEFEVIGDEVNLEQVEDALYDFTRPFMKTLDTWIPLPNDDHLLITFQLYEDQYKIIFDFSGEIADPEVIKDWLNNFQLHNSLSIFESYISKEEFLITLQLDIV